MAFSRLTAHVLGSRLVEEWLLKALFALLDDPDGGGMAGGSIVCFIDSMIEFSSASPESVLSVTEQ